jgi:hypothetical protein
LTPSGSAPRIVCAKPGNAWLRATGYSDIDSELSITNSRSTATQPISQPTPSMQSPSPVGPPSTSSLMPPPAVPSADMPTVPPSSSPVTEPPPVPPIVMPGLVTGPLEKSSLGGAWLLHAAASNPAARRADRGEDIDALDTTLDGFIRAGKGSIETSPLVTVVRAATDTLGGVAGVPTERCS